MPCIVPPRRVSFKTLGCKLNQAETESIATGFKSLGWDIVEFGQPADVIVINSCTVTNTADRKSRLAMNQALRIVEENSVSDIAFVVMAGCYADGHREAMEDDGRILRVGNDGKSHLHQIVDAHFKGKRLLGQYKSARKPFDYLISKRVFRTRAMIKIQDGCDNFCTFCIIPFVRGSGISRPLNHTVRAVKEAISSGYREVVLTGVNMSRWEDGKKDFVDLVESCLAVEGDFRLRLGSLEPDRINSGLLDIMTHPKMTPHLHLCLQSGSERILLAMKRQYTATQFNHIAGEFRRRIPQFNLTTDIIIGFPGESENDFLDTVHICEQLKFGHIHTFPYSRRSRTIADKMDNQVPETVKRYRGKMIRSISERGKRLFRESMRGSLQSVLAERADLKNGRLIARGLSANYVPIRFEVTATQTIEHVRNTMFSVRIQSCLPGNNPDLMGVID